MATESTGQSSRGRALIAIGALAALGILIAVVLLATSESEHELAAAPQECLDRWNNDEQAVATGVHNAVSHGYTRVQVAYSSADAKKLSEERIPGGGCAIVFAASQLDPEPIAAAKIYLEGAWVPLSTVADPARLSELQSEAVSAASAALTQDGRVSPLGEGGLA